MKKIRHFFLTTLAVLCSTLTTWADYNGESVTPTTISGGEFDGYYAIGTAAELYGFAALVNGGTVGANAVLTDDIVVNLNVPADGNLNGATMYRWTPIGTTEKPFEGTFDGNGHTISGLYFDTRVENVGLIGYENGATIKNVGVVDSYLYGFRYVGGICGCGYKVTITNCYNTGTVTGSSSVGGICGSSGTQTNCYNTGTVSGSSFVGGICGYYGTQTNCYYLEGCGSQNTGGVSATAEEFASGKIAYLLNGRKSDNNNVWRQNLGDGDDVDAFPVLDKNHKVVFALQPCVTAFNNTGSVVNPHSSVDEITGYCPVCGKYSKEATRVNGVYQIGNAAQLYWFAQLVNEGKNTANAVLTADIVVNENVLTTEGELNGTPNYSWTPIGTSSKEFKGTFDGNGHTISGLYFDNTTNSNYPDGGIYVGLIGYAGDYYTRATIKNVGILGSYLRGYQYVGGICGSGGYATITNCYNTGTVSGSSSYVGGICGYGNTITDSHNTGTISSSGSFVGGICGSGSTQTNCYNTGTVSGSSNVGGICGYQGTQDNCYNTGAVRATGRFAGGICGNGGTQTNCYNKGAVSGTYYVGGICGYQGTQDNCYYLAGCAKDGQPVVQNGVGNATEGQTTDDVAGETIAATAEEFASGEITYLLNGSTSGNNNVWRQNLNNGAVDAYPVLDKNHGVVYLTHPCATEFSNNAVKEHPSMTATGHCTACGQFFAHGTLVDESNYSSLNLSADFVGYYAISNSGELYWLANEVNNGDTTINAVLTKDITVNTTVIDEDGNLNGTPTYSWTPIGTYDNKYKGTFDGNGHTISGLYFKNTTNSNYPDGGIYVGLIGYANGATIKNVGVIDSYLVGYRCVGGICGIGGTQTNCYNTGTVRGTNRGAAAGGICGNGGTQTNCYNKGKVGGQRSYGGICGIGGTQTNCYCLEGSSSSSGGGFFATAEEFASGKIAYLLNGSTSGNNNVWRQNLNGEDTDAFPVLDKTHAVVYATLPCLSFSNDANNTHKDHPSIMDVTGYCPTCGQFAFQGTLVTESNYSSLNLSADFVGYYAISKSAELYWFANEVNNNRRTTINAVLTADIVVNLNVPADGNLNGATMHSWTPIGILRYGYAGTFDGNGHTISGLYFNNTTSGDYPDGGNDVGLIGQANGATIKNVGVIGSYLRGHQWVGGICGVCSGTTTTITNCYNTGTVSGGADVGGICGYYGTIENCYNTGAVTGSSYYVGGICGYYGDQTNCYNTGTVSGSAFVGGICGYWGSQTNCYNTGTVTGSSYSVGGICGTNGVQTNCYYLAGCAKDGQPVVQYGVGNSTEGETTADVPGETTAATAEEFASGKIAYLLNGNNNNAWYQDLYSDGYPLLDNTHNFVSGYIEEDGDTYTVVGNAYLATNYEIAAGKTLNVPAGTSLTTTGNAVITNNGTLFVNGTVAGNNLAGNGSYIFDQLAETDITFNKESYPYKRADYTLDDGLDVTIGHVMCGKTFTFDDSKTTVEYADNFYVGDATVTWTNANGSSVSKTFSITPKILTISNIKAEGKTYDGNTATTVSYTADVFNGDVITFGTTATFADKNAGTNKAVSFDYTKSGADANNYAFANATGSTTANITPRELAISSVSAAGKEYDGNTATTVTIAASNIVSGDVVTFGTAAAFDDKNVGTNKTVNFTYTKSGADAANYSFAQATGTAKANITAKGLTLSNFTASDKTFDGTTNATGGSFSDDRVSGDALEFSFDYAFADKNAANAVAVNFSNIAISGGADKDNYTLLTTSGTGSAKISPVTDEVVLNFTMPTRTVMYNGQANRYEMPTADELFSTNNELYRMYGGFQPADNDAFQAARANVLAQTEVGEYIFGYNSGTLVNTSANFTNVKFNVTDGKLIITPNTNVVVTITENSKELNYNTEEQSVSGYTVTNIEDETGVYTENDFTFSGNAVATGTTVGTYPMELSAADFSNTNSNFADVTFNIVDGALTITKAPVAPNKPEAAIETRYINTQLVALPADWAWSEYAALAMGNNTATANYTGADKGNYEIESVEVTIIRGECLHNEGNEILYTLEPTCTRKGYSGNLSCKLCGEIYEMGDSIPALGHDFVNTVIAPTCTTEGYTEHLCNRCQHIEYSDTVAATGHKADSVVFENVVAATCTAAGSYDSVVYCSVCRVELSRDVVDVSPAGHKADSVQFENIVAATCTVAGSKDSVVYCTVCKAELSRTKIEIPATGHTEVIDEAVAATCTESGKTEGKHCSVCNEVIVAQEDIAALGHAFTNYVYNNDATTTDDGTETSLCDHGCGAKDTRTAEGTKLPDSGTAVSETAANAVSIYAYQNVIVVENADSEIRVYDIMGKLVVRTDDVQIVSTEIRVNTAGVYIVKVGSVAKRVMIND